MQLARERAAEVRPSFFILTSDLDGEAGLEGDLLTMRPYAGSRYIYDLYYEKEAISKQLYDWLLKNGYADGNLIAKWKKQGYEKVRAPAKSRQGKLVLTRS